jgi:tetratricopeptide (TPR) repeat protein
MKKKIITACVFLAIVTAGASRYAWYTLTDFEFRGMHKVMSDDAEGAIKDFNRALKKNPDTSFALVGLAACELIKADIDKAEKLIDAAMPDAKKSGDHALISYAHIIKAMVTGANGKKTEALQECAEAVKWAPCGSMSIEAELCKHRVNLMDD